MIALFGGNIICREEQEDVLKSLKLIPIDEKNMITAKMIITLLGSIFIYLILFMVSLIIETVLHLHAVNMSEVVHYFVVYVLTGIGVFMVISPNNAIRLGNKNMLLRTEPVKNTIQMCLYTFPH